jgi:hypothetical protein
MENKAKLRIILGNIFLFAVLFGLITLNKKLLRPQMNDFGLGQILAGCVPNYLAGFIIPLAAINPILVKRPKHGRKWVFLISFLVFSILTFEEFKPIWGASTQFDYFDIWASGLGAFTAIILYEIARRKAKRQAI